MWITSTRNIAGSPTAILTLATDTSTWPIWLPHATASQPTPLDLVGSRAAGTWALGRRRAQDVTWHVVRRLRDIVTLHALDESGGVVARLTISCSRWYDDCATELILDIDERAGILGRARAQARLDRALTRLERLAAARSQPEATAAGGAVIPRLTGARRGAAAH